MQPNIQPQRCGNCGNNAFQRIDGMYALTGVQKQPDNNITFLPASGIPVVVFVCSRCGELKLYPAKLLGLI